MKIAVCLKETMDTSLNLNFGKVSETLFKKGLIYALNPYDARALKQALDLKNQSPETEVMLISIGPERVENHLKDGLAMGADIAFRIWEEDWYELSPCQKARLLAGFFSIYAADLILMGSKSQDNASGLVGPFTAAMLDVPCIYGVSRFYPENDSNLIAFRNLGKGVREKVSSSLPLVMTVEGGGINLPYASLDKILEIQDKHIQCLSTSDLGVSSQELKKDPVRIAGLSFPRPRTRAAPLDSTLPAFYRILALLQGGISKRKGEVIRGNKAEGVDYLFNLLVKEGIVKLSSQENNNTLENNL